MQRFCRRLYAWIAIFAMAMSALAPAVSRAMGPDEHGRFLVELCSAAGVEWVELTAEEAAFYGETGAVSSESDPAQSALSLDHCPYCSAQFGNALPPCPRALAVLRRRRRSGAAHALPRRPAAALRLVAGASARAPRARLTLRTSRTPLAFAVAVPSLA